MSIDPTGYFFAEVLTEALRKLSRRTSVKIGGVSVFIDARLDQTLDERLAKIDHARANMADALEAMDEMHRQAEDNKRSLEALNRAIEGAAVKRDEVASELETVRTLADLDTEAFRKAVGVPTRVQVWAERLIAFVFGVAASLVATCIWWLVTS